jgi:hypothetical protein
MKAGTRLLQLIVKKKLKHEKSNEKQEDSCLDLKTNPHGFTSM